MQMHKKTNEVSYSLKSECVFVVQYYIHLLFLYTNLFYEDLLLRVQVIYQFLKIKVLQGV